MCCTASTLRILLKASYMMHYAAWWLSDHRGDTTCLYTVFSHRSVKSGSLCPSYIYALIYTLNFANDYNLQLEMGTEEVV